MRASVRWSSLHVVSSKHLKTVFFPRANVDKKNVLENLDLVFMTIDELVDGGCVPQRVLT